MPNRMPAFVPAATANAVAPSAPSQLRTAALRFGAVYFALYSLPWPLGAIPRTEPIAGWWAQGRDTAIHWFGTHVLGLRDNLAPFPTGSGDTTRDWVAFVLMGLLALLASTTWSAFALRGNGPWLGRGLHTWLRYVLAVAMLGYGTAKFGEGQFPAIDAHSLETPWGECSPMGVVWRFMGASPAYTACTGVVECLAGVLLLWRRTSTLGGLVAVGAMTNVLLLNLCYDIPVKLYASHLLLMGALVAAADVPRLLAVFWRHEAVAAAPTMRPAWSWQPWFVGSRIVKYSLVAWLLVGEVQQLVERASRAPESVLDGSYEVIAAEGPGAERLAWLHCYDQTRFGRPTHWLMGMDAKGKNVFGSAFVVDLDAGRLGAPPGTQAGGPQAPVAAELPSGSFTWHDGHETLELALPRARGAVWQLRLRRRRPESFPLLQRGFRWVQEHPYNR